jgi:hypothetical protein
MNEFVFGQLVILGSKFASIPTLARYVKHDNDDYHHVHSFKSRWKDHVTVQNGLHHVARTELLYMRPGRTYNFKAGDEVMIKIFHYPDKEVTEKLAIVESVNDKWKYVALTEPTVSNWESTKLFYFEQIIKKEEYDRFY